MYLAAFWGEFHHLSFTHLSQNSTKGTLERLKEEEATANKGNCLDANRKIVTLTME